MAVGIFVLSSFTSFYEEPINSPAEIRNILDKLEQLPYIQRVQDAMSENNFSESEIDSKTRFLSRSYLIMIVGYFVALSIVSLILLVARVGNDPGTIILDSFGKPGLKWVSTILICSAAVNAILIWLGLHGIGDLSNPQLSNQTDSIITTYVSIILNLSIASVSLLISLIIVRAAFSCVYILFRNAANHENRPKKIDTGG
jgi:hypothetical protein